MHEVGINVLSIVCDVYTKSVRWDTRSFLHMKDFKVVHIINSESVKFLGRKAHFFQLLF